MVHWYDILSFQKLNTGHIIYNEESRNINSFIDRGNIDHDNDEA